MNFPSPSLEDSSSAAIKTIQPTPNEIRRPAKISGSADGITIFVIRLQNPSRRTRATFMWSFSIDATPKAVLTKVGQREHNATVTPDAMNAGLIFSRPISGISASTVMNQCLSGSGINPPTIIRAIGNQTIGDTGLNNAINGVIAAMKVGLSPHKIPIGMAIREPRKNPKKTHARLRLI